MPTRIRQAQPQDAATITRIANSLIRDTLFTFTTQERSPEDIAARLRDATAPFLLAEIDGRVVGFATYGPFRSGPGYRHTQEHSIQLTQAAQGRGLGRALMQRLEDVARQNGVHVLVAGISGANPRAVAFHAAIGFTQSGHMAQVGHKWGQWLDLILMQKQL
ncbi:GNAT family N-acetyltransferase [Pseudophaeobacter leonis]|uniref:GNAT family N-acetyltransferase n=1 Tax=Pseudophaeobacter leonis TaxID=1144477 RepID=UPI0009F654CE|nr:GNAT family N-acetyltransferase [Pseudophaeobacter leonis]